MLDVIVTAAPTRIGGLAGLCGTNDGNKYNDLKGFYGNITGMFVCDICREIARFS